MSASLVHAWLQSLTKALDSPCCRFLRKVIPDRLQCGSKPEDENHSANNGDINITAKLLSQAIHVDKPSDISQQTFETQQPAS